MEQLLDLRNPEHFALVQKQIKRAHHKFSKVAEQSAETFEDYSQRVFLSILEKPCLLNDKKVYSRAWVVLWRAPSHLPFTSGSGRALTIRYAYENRDSEAALKSVPLEDYHRTTLEVDSEGDAQHHAQLEATQEALSEVLNDPTISRSVKAAATAYFNDEPMSQAGARFDLSREAVRQGKATLFKRLKKKLDPQELTV